MPTPFDDVIRNIVATGYHNHRLEDHSDIVSEGIYKDLLVECPYISDDATNNIIKHWTNVPAPGARNRKIDLFIGEPDADGKPDIHKLRICVENKSVITAHRNRDARFDDLNETMQVVHKVRPEAVIAATMMIGVATRVLNVPDKVKAVSKSRPKEFEQNVLPRLKARDQALWKDYDFAISDNRPNDAAQTLAKIKGLPTRPPGHTHVAGYDSVMCAPVFINNVDQPYVDRSNALGINIDTSYHDMIESICRAYRARWHP